jgi:hypothetical protein
VNYNNGSGGDYRYRLSPTNAYKGKASDGTDPGADLNAIQNAINWSKDWKALRNLWFDAEPSALNWSGRWDWDNFIENQGTLSGQFGTAPPNMKLTRKV